MNLWDGKVFHPNRSFRGLAKSFHAGLRLAVEAMLFFWSMPLEFSGGVLVS
jgi:hypothetical protein